MDEELLDVEDLLSNKKPKKKVDGKAKGNRTELQLCKMLSKHFGEDFNRSVGSGNRWGQVSLSENAKQVLTGDVSVPEGFLWVIESKGGYERDIDLNGVCDGKGISRLDEFIEQSSRDGEQCGRKPMICWKRARKPWLLMVRLKDLGDHDIREYLYRIHYRDWVIVSLEECLGKTKKDFWFKNG